jgi:hypothetical protein
VPQASTTSLPQRFYLDEAPADFDGTPHSVDDDLEKLTAVWALVAQFDRWYLEHRLCTREG